MRASCCRENMRAFLAIIFLSFLAAGRAADSTVAADLSQTVRSALDRRLVAAAQAWADRDFEAARAEFRSVLATAGAPAQFRGYAHLRIAQTFAAETDMPAAKAQYARIQVESSYPKVFRDEARELLNELERASGGLPARDRAASRTKLAPVAPYAAEFYVAPGGRDTNPGTREEPFATLEKARDRVRALKANGLPGPVAVRLLPGQHPRNATFELAAADSGSAEAPIVYHADVAGTAVLYGGARLSGFELVADPAVLSRLPAEARGRVFQCDLRGQGIDFAPLQERGYGKAAPKATSELFFNGAPMRLARWPNRGFVNGDRILEPGSAKTRTPSAFTYLDGRHARWTNAADAWLYGYFMHGWADRALKVLRIDPEARKVECGPYDFGGKGMAPIQWFNQGRIRYFAFNLLEELDEPGEWYLDRSRGMLYLYPPSDPAHAAVETGLLEVPMLAMTGVSHVRLEGLVFDLSRANGMTILDCSHCLVAGCTVRRFASDGITIRGGSDNGIFGCDLCSLGRRATEVDGGDRRTLSPGRHFVENCRMFGFGRLDHTYVPAVQLEGCGNRVAHNLFYECPSSVVRIEGNDHVLEYNRVHRAVLESEDQGAMELFGNPTYRGVVFRFNHFSDIGGEYAGGPAGRAAIRLDDTISGMLVYGNIFHRAAQSFGGIQINSGRDHWIVNNLFAECSKGITGGYNPRNKHWERLGVDRAFILSDLYLERYPELRHVRELPGLSSVWRNVFWKCGPAFPGTGPSSADKFDWLANAEPADEDPGFVDPARGDFRLRPGASISARIGFRPIPADEIGLYAHPYRASWPVDMAY